MSRHDELIADGFVQVCSTKDVPAMTPRRVVVGGRGVLVCRHLMRFRAVDEMCPHKMKSMQHGLIMGGELVCPHHQFTFDIQTGKCKNRRCLPISTYETEVEDGMLFVKAPPVPTLPTPTLPEG